MNQKLLLDTNSLMYSIKNKMDIRMALLSIPLTFEILIPKCVIDELAGLSKTYWYARAALEYGKNFNIIESYGTGDNCILNMAIKLKCFVLTNDRGLINRLRSKNIKILMISNGKSIVMK